MRISDWSSDVCSSDLTAGPTERVADLLLAAKYKRMPLPLQVAGLDFDVAGAFVAVGHFADLVVIGDMAAQGERKVLQQVEGIARALDVMRSRRRSEERRVGKTWVSTCRSRWAPDS